MKQKAPTLVQPLSHGGAAPYAGPSDKNGVTLNLQALTAFREALGAGIYAGAFVGPHRSPLYPHLGKVKPIPTRRPIILSQEYIDTLNTQLTHAGLPGLTGLYNILSVDITTSNALFKRAVDNTQFFDIYDPFAPKQAAEFRSGMDQAADSMAHGPLKLTDRFMMRKFKPIYGPYGNFTLEDFVSLAERMIVTADKTSTKSAKPAPDAVVFRPEDHDSGTAQIRFPTANQPPAPTRNRQPSPSRLGTPLIPSPFGNERQDFVRPVRGVVPAQLDPQRRPGRRFKRSTKSKKQKKNKVDASLSAQLEDSAQRAANLSHSSADRLLNDTLHAEEERIEAYGHLSQDLETAMQAVKALQDSYRSLYEEIDKARLLFADSDPVRKSLDHLLASATLPSSLPVPQSSTAAGNVTR